MGLSKPKRLQAPSRVEPFVMSDGRPWLAVRLGARKFMALADTGSTQPFLAPEIVKLVDHLPVGETEVRTPFGVRSAAKVQLSAMEINGRRFEKPVTIVERRAADQVDPIIGASILFSSSNTYFSQDGILFDIDESLLSSCQHVPVVIDLTGNTYQSPLAAVYFQIKINGEIQKVFFDTGQSEPLVGTARSRRSDRPFAWGRPGLLVHPSSGRVRLSWSQPSLGRLEIGNQELELEYVRQSGLDHEDADFFMGAGIFKHYSILVVPRKGRACFIPVQ
ncbi:hypothetical protein [uncultured Sphingomonas sp.]|uniref:hypothetical protein n=1 Tax=uncultured Sphingomonas sp. TaxID=158754 RepID=UPI0025E09226|nr:hypothetical protein [uncultured Sphingomonas sp.]